MIRQTTKLAFLFFSTVVSLDKRLFPNCSYVTDSKEWSLTGVCTVVTQYTILWCEWRAKNTTQMTLIHGTITGVPREHYWECSATFELPSLKGLHTYEILLDEFEYNSSWRDAFSVRITDPGQPIIKNCPEHVTEGESVTCECSSERDGEPRPVFSWPGQTDSSLLRLYEVRTNMTHTCEMSWGKNRKTVSYILTVSSSIVTHKERGGKGDDNHGGSGGDGGGGGGSDDDDDDHDFNGVLFPIVGVVAVVIIIAVTTFIVIVILRRKRAVSNSMPSNSRQTEVELIENSYYGGFQFDRWTEFKVAGDDDAEVTESARNEREILQPDLYAFVGTNKERQTTQADVYLVLEKIDL